MNASSLTFVGVSLLLINVLILHAEPIRHNSTYKIEEYVLDLSKKNLTTIDKDILKRAESEVHKLILDENESFNVPDSSVLIQDENLQTFQCIKCNISRIFAETFSKLPGLRKIVIRENPLNAIHPNAFRENKYLQELDLRENQLKSFNSMGILMDLKDLNIILLSHNQFNLTVKYPILQRPYMGKFECESCNITKISPEAFSGVMPLKELHLRDNKLTHFNLTLLGLRTLDLSQNPHLDLSGNSLNFPDLEHFKCNDCSTKIIDDKLFANCTDLLSLEMRNNGLHKISHNAFSGTKFLKRLMIENNFLRHIPGKVIMMDNLQDLCLDYNPIEMTEENRKGMMFYFMGKLGDKCTVDQNSAYSEKLMHQIPMDGRILLVRTKDYKDSILTLRENNITFIFPHHFQSHLDNFTALVMDGNREFNFRREIPFTFYEKLEKFQCNGCGIDKIYGETFNHTPHLRELELRNNKITHFSLAVFHHNIPLQSLILDDNPIELLYGKVSMHFEDIEVLLVGEPAAKRLQVLPPDEDESLLHLERFSCINCGMTKIMEDTFEFCPRIHVIDLSGHNLKTLSDVLKPNSYLIDVNLLGSLQEFPVQLVNSSLNLKALCIDYKILNTTEIAMKDELAVNEFINKLEVLQCSNNPTICAAKVKVVQTIKHEFHARQAMEAATETSTTSTTFTTEAVTTEPPTESTTMENLTDYSNEDTESNYPYDYQIQNDNFVEIKGEKLTNINASAQEGSDEDDVKISHIDQASISKWT
ncbi:protein artichoke-like [Phlebotomus argentipes]|uniref:protein artichoke-like n=1 Tax=Phlebotomus argentipes TaxID=94469 RepID=UPI002892E16B|nr:protein artichoke-like [Phlebotomus argentipes]